MGENIFLKKIIKGEKDKNHSRLEKEYIFGVASQKRKIKMAVRMEVRKR